MKTVEFNPALGLARQGDIVIAKLPEGFSVDRTVYSRVRETKDYRIVLAEGEATGHHHSVLMRAAFPEPVKFWDNEQHRAATIAPPDVKVSEAALHRDGRLLARLQSVGWVRSGHLAQGFLVVEGAPARLEHQEHDAISIPPGEYYVGRQESIDLQTGVLARVLD